MNALKSRANYNPAPANIQYRNQFAQANKNLVHLIVHRMASKCPNESHEDLFQVGYMGMLSAIEKFDELKGNKFSSFAVPHIQGAILHYLRDKAPRVKVSRSAVEKAGKIRQLRKQFLAAGRDLSEDAIASKLGLSNEEWELIKLSVAKHNLTVSWDELPYEPAIDSEEMEASEEIESLYKGLAQLSSNHRFVLNQRYILGKDIKAIAKILRKTVSETECLINEAIGMLNFILLKQC